MAEGIGRERHRTAPPVSAEGHGSRNSHAKATLDRPEQAQQPSTKDSWLEDACRSILFPLLPPGCSASSLNSGPLHIIDYNN